MKTTQLSLLFCGWLIATPSFTYATNHNPADPCPPTMSRAKSAYSDYVPDRDVPLQSWQETNANAAAGAGHAAHSMAPADDMSGKNPAEQRSVTAMPAKAASTDKSTGIASPSAPIRARGVVQQINKANAKVKITHQPIEQLGWPKMTMFFKVKEPGLLDQIMEGSDTQFTLEKVGSGYVISGFGK